MNLFVLKLRAKYMLKKKRIRRKARKQSLCAALLDSAFKITKAFTMKCRNKEICTPPLIALDERAISIHVKQKEDTVIISDGGKTFSEFFSQGVELDNEDCALMDEILERYELKVSKNEEIYMETDLAKAPLAMFRFASGLIAMSVFLTEWHRARQNRRNMQEVVGEPRKGKPAEAGYSNSESMED